MNEINAASIETELNVSEKQKLIWSWQNKVDQILSLVGLPSKRWSELQTLREAQTREGDAERLSASELKKMIEFQLLAEDIDYRRNYFRSTELDKTLPGQFVKIVGELIEADAAIKSVMDIGVRYAFPDHVLASRHPDIKFIGVDFMPNLAEFNSEFQRENLTFVSGYALDLLEKGQVGADVAIFSATAIAIRNAELRNLLRNLAKRSRYVVFNELIYPLPGGLYIDPRSLPVDQSVATFIQPVPWEGHTGPICKTHNFAGMLEDAGFEVIKYRVYQPSWTSQYVVQAVGRKT